VRFAKREKAELISAFSLFILFEIGYLFDLEFCPKPFSGSIGVKFKSDKLSPKNRTCGAIV
jgi:hypothetical protein